MTFLKFGSKVPYRPFGPFYEILQIAYSCRFSCTMLMVCHNYIGVVVPSGCLTSWGPRHKMDHRVHLVKYCKWLTFPPYNVLQSWWSVYNDAWLVLFMVFWNFGPRSHVGPMALLWNLQKCIFNYRFSCTMLMVCHSDTWNLGSKAQDGPYGLLHS